MKDDLLHNTTLVCYFMFYIELSKCHVHFIIISKSLTYLVSFLNIARYMTQTL